VTRSRRTWPFSYLQCHFWTQSQRSRVNCDLNSDPPVLLSKACPSHRWSCHQSRSRSTRWHNPIQNLVCLQDSIKFYWQPSRRTIHYLHSVWRPHCALSRFIWIQWFACSVGKFWNNAYAEHDSCFVCQLVLGCYDSLRSNRYIQQCIRSQLWFRSAKWCAPTCQRTLEISAETPSPRKSDKKFECRLASAWKDNQPIKERERFLQRLHRNWSVLQLRGSGPCAKQSNENSDWQVVVKDEPQFRCCKCRYEDCKQLTTVLFLISWTK